ncbi:MAG: outer membrane lipoprotein carrier protein LolA [Elusimicrobiota bacterium]
MSRSAAFFVIFLLAGAFAAPVLAGEATPDATPSAAVEFSTQTFVWRSTEPLTLDAVLAHFAYFDANLHSLSAHFTQNLAVPETGMSSSIEGNVGFLKPERIRIEHIRPERQTIVADGKDVWIHRHSRDQVIHSKLEDWKQSDPAIGNLMQFGSYGKMLQAYDVALDSAAGINALILRPKTAQKTAFTLRLELSRDTLFPSATILEVGSMSIQTRFDDLTYNPDLQGKDFRFTPPAGAEVFRNFKPPKFQP